MISKISKDSTLVLIMIIYFIAGYYNIYFALVILPCYIFAFYYIFFKNNRDFCKYYCFRGAIFDKLKIIKKKRNSLKKNNTKLIQSIVFNYFLINIFILTMSTVMVFLNRMNSLNEVRFLLLFNLSFIKLQTLVDSSSWILHLSYRLYSMTVTTVLTGILFGMMYKPRIWCSVCPYRKIGTFYINRKNVK